jgi:hypothetical protein
VDDQQAQKVNEAARKFSEALMESYKTAAEQGMAAQQPTAQLTQDFFNAVMSNLYMQAESNRAAIQELTEQARRGQEAAQTLARESVNAHMEFLDSMFSYYRESVRSAERNAEE